LTALNNVNYSELQHRRAVTCGQSSWCDRFGGTSWQSDGGLLTTVLWILPYGMNRPIRTKCPGN